MLFSRDKSKAKPQGVKIGECTKCHCSIGDQHPYTWCSECGDALSEEVINLIPALAQEKKRWALSEEEKNLERENLNSQIKSVIATTAPSLENYTVVQTLDILTAEVVFGLNILNSMFLGLETDFSSGQDNSTNELLRDARKTCLFELKKEALALGANAVIGVNLTYSELPFGGKRMLLLVAVGTAVKIEPVNVTVLS